MENKIDTQKMNKAQRIEKAKEFLTHFVGDYDYYCLIGAISDDFDLDWEHDAKYLVDHMYDKE